jgi:aromatic ring-cleaving dioxygenase
MLITLPVSARQRKRTLDWLIANRIGHLVLFQAVKIHDAGDAERFKAWLADAA